MIVPASSIQPTSIKDDNRGSHLLLYQQRRMSFLWRQRASSLTADEEVDKCGLRTDPLTGGLSFCSFNFRGALTGYDRKLDSPFHCKLSIGLLAERAGSKGSRKKQSEA
jgi:hypothetical protein